MTERLTTSKLIRDLSGKGREPFFGPAWQEENKLDIARARQMHREAQEAHGCADIDEEFAKGPDDGREDVEELPGRGPWA